MLWWSFCVTCWFINAQQITDLSKCFLFLVNFVALSRICCFGGNSWPAFDSAVLVLEIVLIRLSRLGISTTGAVVTSAGLILEVGILGFSILEVSTTRAIANSSSFLSFSNEGSNCALFIALLHVLQMFPAIGSCWSWSFAILYILSPIGRPKAFAKVLLRQIL